MVSTTDLPKISIITAVFNSRAFIDQAVESVINQSCQPFEHLIIDGGSTDGTLEALDSYPHLKVISETDRGIYDAWNKGIRIAGGDVIGFLNSDDLYEPDALLAVSELFSIDPEVEAVCGSAVIFEDGVTAGETIHQFSSVQAGDLLRRVTQSAPIINAWFFRKSVFSRVAMFNPNFKIAGDSDFFLWAERSGLKYRTVDQVIIRYRKHPGSLTIFPNQEQWSRVEQEVMAVAEMHLADEATRPSVRVWHSNAALFLTKHALRNLHFLAAGRYLVRGWKVNPNFLQVLAGKIMRHTDGV